MLLHVTSLPGGHGIGDLGEAAYRFVDWLVEAGQCVWQVLPLGPPGFGGSPYASSSAFAGSPWLISLDGLVAEGLLDGAGLEGASNGGSMDLPAVQHFKTQALARAFERFQPAGEYHAFCMAAAYWLDDFARVRAEQGADPEEERFVQFLFERQWQALRRYANEHGIRILGDVPIFVAEGSVD
ncbi:MAG: 4-alpha-glucanotransferase, partial [Chloroflexota bacterium]